MSSSTPAMFAELFQRGATAFRAIKKEALAPRKAKVLKEWKIAAAATMVKRTSQTLRNLKDDEPFTVRKNSRNLRIYNLKEINQLRDHFGTRPSKPKEDDHAAVISFTNFKGGAGKTTSAVSMSQYLAREGYKVLFIDCDSQGSATEMFGYIPDEDFQIKESILNILIGEQDDIAPLAKKTHWEGLDLVPANLGLHNAELIVPTLLHDETHTKVFHARLDMAIKKSAARKYDYIIIDCPPSMNITTMNALFAANALIIPVPPMIIDFASTLQFLKMVSEVMERLPTKNYDFIRILLTKHNNKTTANQMQDLMKACFANFVMSNSMPQSEAITKAAANMQTIYEVDKSGSDRATYERALQHADRVNEEIAELVKTMCWKMVVS